ncbi:MAG: response regulator [Rhodomicrobium sp.]
MPQADSPSENNKTGQNQKSGEDSVSHAKIIEDHLRAGLEKSISSGLAREEALSVVLRWLSEEMLRLKPETSARPSSRTAPLILVVEDDAILALGIELILKEAGFDVLGPANTVAQALSLMQEKGCDAAVLDVNLLDGTSEPVARRLLDSGTPFVVASGHSREQHPPVFNGASALAKPVEPELLIAEITRCIGRGTSSATDQA